LQIKVCSSALFGLHHHRLLSAYHTRSYQAALTLYEQLDEPWAQAKLLVKIGSIYAAQGEKQEAIQKFTQARTLSVQLRLDPRTGRPFLACVTKSA